MSDELDRFAEAVFMLMASILFRIILLGIHASLLSLFSRWTFAPVFGLPEAGFRECVGLLLSIWICSSWVQTGGVDAA